MSSSHHHRMRYHMRDSLFFDFKSHQASVHINACIATPQSDSLRAKSDRILRFYVKAFPLHIKDAFSGVNSKWNCCMIAFVFGAVCAEWIKVSKLELHVGERLDTNRTFASDFAKVFSEFLSQNMKISSKRPREA